MGKIFIFFLLCPLAFGQAWSGILDPNRAIDWTGAGITGGVPTVSTACGTQPTLGGNATTNVTNINAAITADRGGGSYCVINLPAGTYHLAGSLVQSFVGRENVVIRGAGANSTFLIWDSVNSNCNGLGAVAMCWWNGNNESAGSPGLTFTWTAASYAKGATAATFSSVSSLSVGSVVMLDQTDPSSDPGNTIWPCKSTGTTGNCAQQGTNLVRTNRSQFQPVTIADCRTDHAASGTCNTTSVVFSPGLYSPNWSASNSPGGWGSTSLPFSNFGIENVSLDYSGVSLLFGTQFTNATNVWVSGVRSVNGVTAGPAAHHHFDIWQTTHFTIQNSYLYGSNNASEGYGISPSSESGDGLVQNVICQHIASCIVMQASTGNVFGYWYAVDNFFGNGFQQGDAYHHAAGDSFNLFEGGEGIETVFDAIHGTDWMNTIYRTRYSGFDPATESGGYTQALWAFMPMAYSRYLNLVNSVLGTSGKHTVYQAVPSSTTDCGSTVATTIMPLGWSDQNGTLYGGPGSECLFDTFTVFNDLLVHSTLMRWGNYDTVRGIVGLCTANGSPVAGCTENERGNAAPTYPALASPSTTFPASFYLASQPAFWGAMPYPAVGGDVTGGNISGVGGHAYHNPAANCYLNVMGGSTNGSSGVLTFNAATCYAGGPSTVATPTFSPVAGAYTSTQSVTISTSTGGATLCYTADGSTPTANGAGTCTHGTTYSTAVSVSVSQTLKAIGSVSGSLDSAVGSAAYTITVAVAAPTFSPVAGSYVGTQNISISTTTGGATLCYTTDGSTPTANGLGTCTHGMTYTTAVAIPASATVKAIGSEVGFTDSTVGSAAYTITAPSGTTTTGSFGVRLGGGAVIR